METGRNQKRRAARASESGHNLKIQLRAELNNAWRTKVRSDKARFDNIDTSQVATILYLYIEKLWECRQESRHLAG
jgi:hypothetical protein